MLQVKSFKIGDGELISEFLKKYRLAQDAHVLISNGEIAVPYEDGLPPTREQKIISIKELLFAKEKEQELMLHSQKVLDIQVKGIKAQMSELDAKSITPKSKGEYDDKKANEKELKRLQNVLNQTENQILMNKSELTNIATNIAVFNETIALLEAGPVE